MKLFQNLSTDLAEEVVVVVLLCSHSRNDVPPVPQRNVSIAAERGAVRPSIAEEVV